MMNVSINVPSDGGSKCYDDDGRLKRTGTMWTASAHIITAVIGSGVLSLAWAVAQLGWVAGPTAMLLFAYVTYYTSILLSSCYRNGDPDTGNRNYTYMDAVRANMGGFQVKVCGAIQYLNLFGTAISYTIAASVSMMAIERSNCLHTNGHGSSCEVSSNGYMIAFGVFQILFSQIPDFDQVSWLSIVAAVMSFSYSFIGLGFGIEQVAESGEIKGSLTGISVGAVVGSQTITETTKIWRSFQALGAIAFAYSYSMILIEIQDTIKSPPSEYKTMNKATLISVAVTTVFYMLCGCFGYAAFGDSSPSNLISGFGLYGPHWLLDIANAAIVFHLVGAYQVYCQPLFAFVEKTALDWFPGSKFITKEFTLLSLRLTLFRLVWRSMFVIVTTFISMVLPFFSDVVGILGALGFWPLTVYFPVEMYIVQKKIPKWSGKWISLQILSVVCLVVTVAAAAGSIAGVVSDLNSYKPFHASYR